MSASDVNSVTLSHPTTQLTEQLSSEQPQADRTDRIALEPNALEPKSSNDQGYRLLWGLAAGLLIGGGVVWTVTRTNSASVPAEAAASAPPARAVEVVQLTNGEGVQVIELIGQVEARSSATLRSQTSGVVQQILVEPGDAINQGMTIAILDDSDQQLALSQAQANLAAERSNLAELDTGTRPEIIEQRRAAVESTQAREQEAIDNLQRTQDLVSEGALSERSLIEARTSVDATRAARLEEAAALAEAIAGPRTEEIAAQQAVVAASQAAVNQAQLALNRTRIQATANGIVDERIANVGDYLEAGDSLLSSINQNDLDVFLEIPEELTGQMVPGLTVNLTTRALPDWQGQATITGTIPTADAASRRQRVRLQLNNPPEGLLPGMAIQAQLEQTSDVPSFTVSRDALVQRAGEWVVFAVENEQAQILEVELIADMGETVAIASNQLQDSDAIVVRGGEGLQDGAVVRITNEQG